MTIFSSISEAMRLMFRRPVRFQFAALCYRVGGEGDTPEILMLTSRDTGRWVIPKGWPMGDKPGFEVAEREALEEAGITGEIEREPLGYFGYDKGLDDGLVVPCRVQVHALKATGSVEKYKEKGKRRLEWVSPSLAAERVREPELKQLIREFSRRFAKAA
ncbi:8-oxo-dGTP pyrophosphatase MutT (NUDIX family) [Rhizobium alvei]